MRTEVLKLSFWKMIIKMKTSRRKVYEDFQNISELKLKSLNVAFSSCALKPSGSRALHANSINVVFFNGLNCLVLRTTSHLDAFSAYSMVRSCAACFITTAIPVAPKQRSSRTRCLFHSDNNTPSRYYTNCLTYMIQSLWFCFVWTIPSSHSHHLLNERSTF